MKRVRNIEFTRIPAASGTYQVAGAHAAGVATISLDGGAGGDSVDKGDILLFAGDSNVYTVIVGFDGSSGDVDIAGGLKAALADNAAVSLPAWSTIDGYLDEGFEPGSETAQKYQTADSKNRQDGVLLEGSFMATGDVLPDDESADYWLRFNLEGDEVAVYGGFDGLAVCVSDGGYNPLGGGPHYSMIEYSASGDQHGDTFAEG